VSRWGLLLVALLVGVAGMATASIASPSADASDSFGLVDPATGEWHLYDAEMDATSFFFGNPGDYPFMGDWDCDGVDTPGLYRQSDGYVYLRNANDRGIADVSFFFGDPGDVPVAGDFNANGCDTVSIYRRSEARFFVVNELGTDGGGLGAADYSFVFGNVGDKPFIGDFNGNGQDTIGLHRESTGLVYYRNTNTKGIADHQFIFGDPGDRLIAGNWNNDGIDSPGVFRPSNTAIYLRHENSQGNADESWTVGRASWRPVSGSFGLATPPATTTSTSTSTSTTTTSTSTTTSTTTTTLPGCDDELIVTGLGDADGGTHQLREAIEDVCDGGTIRVLPGTITLTRGPLVIPSSKTVAIAAADLEAGIVIDANRASRVVTVETDAELTLDSVTITGGSGGRAGISNSGTLTLENSTVTENDATLSPVGGIHSSGTLTINNSTISDNTGKGGGGINNSGTAEIRDSEILGNNGANYDGGGIRNSGTMTIIRTRFDNNRALVGGGIHNSGNITVIDSTIIGGSSMRGAGIFNASGTVRLEGTTSVTGPGVVAQYGGGISNAGTIIMLDAASISANEAQAGAGMHNSGLVEMYDQSTISGNTTKNGSGEGGGIYNTGTVNLYDDSSITGNHAETNGGGIHNGGQVTLRGSSTVTFNSASIAGGGIYNTADVMLFPGTSVTNNTPDDCNGCP
jgi:hypothetical protein